MAAPIITPIPTPPIRSDAPADFSAKADAFAASLPQFVTETNASAAFLDQRAIDADASATAAAASEAAAEADRAEVAANTETVASNTATVVARADEVAANTLQVESNTQQVATNTQAVADALASVADGPVTSVNGMTGVVTGVLTETGRQGLDAYTLGSAAATGLLDLETRQVFRIAATGNLTISLVNAPPADRAMTVVVHLYDPLLASRTISWFAGINWSGGSIPVPEGTKMTIILFWTGSEWVGGAGPKS